MSIEVTEKIPFVSVPTESSYIGSGDKRLVINIDKPRWDQNTYYGRLMHFVSLRNPVNLFASNEQLQEAREIVRRYKCGAPMDDVSVDELWAAKQLFDSAYHPDTGEKVSLWMRNSATLPVDGSVTGLLMAYYKSLPGIVFWQCAKQTHTTAAEMSNRPCDKPKIISSHYGISYALATGAAIMTAIGFGSFIEKRTPPVLGRLVPFAGVAAATCVNVPFLRLRSLYEGIPVYDEHNNLVGNSGKAAVRDIACTTLGTIGMIAPAMALTPFLMARLEKRQVFCRYPWSQTPIQIALVALCIMFATPMVRAIFPEMCPMDFSGLEPGLQAGIIKKRDLPPDVVYYRHSM